MAFLRLTSKCVALAFGLLTVAAPHRAEVTVPGKDRVPETFNTQASSPFAMDDVFDDVDVGPLFKKPANHFGIPAFDYFTWAVTSGYLGSVFNPKSEDMDEVSNDHLEFLKMPWDETRVEEYLKEAADVPVENIKQTLVGALISHKVTNVYENKAEEISRVISEVVNELKKRDPDLDAEALQRWANQALEFILSAEKIEQENNDD
jgi:hypothetical protein